MSDEELDFGEDDFEHIDDSPIKKSTNFHSIENEEDFDLDDATYLPTDLTASGYSGRKVEVFSEDYDNILKDIDNTVKFYRTSKSQNPYNFEEEKSIQDINRVIAEYKRLSLESGDFDVLNLNKKMSDIDIESMQAKRSLQQYKETPVPISDPVKEAKDAQVLNELYRIFQDNKRLNEQLKEPPKPVEKSEEMVDRLHRISEENKLLLKESALLDERLQEISQKASQVASKPLPQPTPKPVVLFEPPIIQSKTLTPRAIPTKEDFPVETAAEHSDDDEEEEKIPTFTMENESAPLRSAPKAQVTPLTLDALSTSRDAATPRDTASTREMVKHSQTLKDSFINFNGNEVSENIKSKYPNLVERLKEANSLMGGLLENSKLRNVRKPELSESPVVSRTPTPRQTMTSTRIKKTRRVHEPQYVYSNVPSPSPTKNFVQENKSQINTNALKRYANRMSYEELAYVQDHMHQYKESKSKSTKPANGKDFVKQNIDYLQKYARSPVIK